MDGESGGCVPENPDSGNWWDDIVDAILSPLKAIGEFLSKFWDVLTEFIKDLFIPSDDFWSSNINDLQSTLSSKFGIQGMQNIFDSIENAQSSNIPDFKMTLFGQTFVIFDFKFITNNLTIIHSIAYLVFGLLLIKYNLNNVYKIVRGGSLYDS